MEEVRLHITIMAISGIITIAAVGLGAGMSFMLARTTDPDQRQYQQGVIATVVEDVAPLHQVTENASAGALHTGQ